jgi:hypothetical protein
MTRLSLFLGVIVLWLASAGFALGEGLGPNKQVFGGQALSCRDFRGTPVRFVEMTQLGDVGRALIITRMPVIALDPDRLATLPPALQILFYEHECAHHMLGHMFTRTLTSETEADCWSINFGRDNGLFTRADVAAFAPYLAKSKGSPFGHLPGPERAAFLLSCFDKADSSQAALGR